MTDPRPAEPTHAPGFGVDIVIGVLVGAGIFVVAIDGGSYDLVVRHQWGIALWWAIALAALGGLVPRGRPAASGWLVLAALVVLGAWIALSLMWTSSDERTLAEVARVAAHLGVVALLVGSLGPTTWRAAAAGATVGAVVVCAYAMVTRLVPDAFAINTAVFAEDARRLSKPLGYWNAVGSWAGMTAALCLAWSAHSRSLAWRGIALACVPLAAVAAYLTYSRASLGGIALGLVVLFAASRNRWTLVLHAVAAALGAAIVVVVIRGRPEIADATGDNGAAAVAFALSAAGIEVGAIAAATGRFGLDHARLPVKSGRITAAATLVAIALVGIGALAAYGDEAWDQFTAPPASSVGDDPAARLTNLNGGRYQIWDAAWQSVAEHPWKGTGAGTFEYTWNQNATRAEFVRDAHSLYLESLSELGVPGLTLILLLLGSISWALVSAIRATSDASHRGALAGCAGAIAAFFLGAGVDWLWESTANAVLALVLVGAVLAAGAHTLPVPRWPLRTAVAAAATLIALVQLPSLVATSQMRQSQKSVLAGDIDRARAQADDAIASEPWAASPLVQRALVDERAGALEAAQDELARAEAREPQNWRIPLIRARVEARLGNRDSAIAAFERAKRLRPLGQFFGPPQN